MSNGDSAGLTLREAEYMDRVGARMGIVFGLSFVAIIVLMLGGAGLLDRTAPDWIVASWIVLWFGLIATDKIEELFMLLTIGIAASLSAVLGWGEP